MKNNICVDEVDNDMKKRCSANKRRKQNAKNMSKPSSKALKLEIGETIKNFYLCAVP